MKVFLWNWRVLLFCTMTDKILLGCSCRVWFLTLTTVHITHVVLLMPSTHMIYLIVYLLQQLTEDGLVCLEPTVQLQKKL